MKKIFLIMLTIIYGAIIAYPQDKKDKGMFREYEPGYYINSIMKDVREVNERMERTEKDKRFFMDQSGADLPNKINMYKTVWRQPPVSQGNTSTCWCFCTTSFFESEVKRLNNKEVKISEMFTVYWEYVEKARRYIRERGNSNFPNGSEANAVTRIYKKYGAVPLKEYTGLTHGRKHHTHDDMAKELISYLKSLNETNAWDEETAISTIKEIMNHYMGKPPEKFKVEGKEYTPLTYLKEYLKINPDDYVDILSYKQEPYWKQAEYKVPDNWWHNDEYYNVPLDDFMKAIKEAVSKGYSISIGGDVSEAGFDRKTQTALVPSFDVPSEFIDDNARQMRFSNGSTTDDHGMHIVGYLEKDGTIWYLLKDSSSGSRNNDEKAPEFGYYFFHEDYVKLKMMCYTVHKDAVKDLLKRF